LKRFSFILSVFFLFQHFAIGQVKIPSPKKAGKSDDKVAIYNSKDVNQFERYIDKWGQPQTLFLGKGIDAKLFLERYYYLDEVSQLVFFGNNQVGQDLLCELSGLEHVIFHIAEYDSNLVNAINNCSFLKEVSFYFQRDVPIDSRWFNLEHIETLNILGIFTKKQLEEMVPKLSQVKKLETIRFSTDFTRDLPKNLSIISNLKQLGMIDNLSLIQSQTFHDLAVEHHFINYWDPVKRKNIILPFDYYSDRVTLENYDFEYLSNLMGKGQILPYYAYQTPVKKAISKKPQNQLYGVSRYSAFDTVDRSKKPSLYFALNQSIDPLKDDIDLGYEHFIINPTQNQILQTQKGYKLTIPANVLLTEKGEPCQGKVDIYFKLLENLAEMALMGIPTSYDSLNDTYRLMNPKMLLVYASCKNRKLKIKRGFAIDIEVPATVGRDWQLSDYNSFWYPYNFLDYGPVTRYKKDAFNDTQELQKLVDYTGFNERYYNPKYYYLLDEEDQRVKVGRSLKASYKITENSRIFRPYKKGMTLERGEFYLKPGKALIGVRRVSFKDTARKKQTYFRVYNKSDQKLFVELKAFKKYVFKYIGSESRRTFTKNLLRKKKFHDIRIHYQPGSNQGVVELKYAEGFVQLPFSVVDTKIKKSAEKQRAKFLKRFLKYKSLLSRRKKFHQKHLVNYNLQVNNERPDIGVPRILPIIELGAYAIAEVDSLQATSNINLIVNDASGLPIDVQKIVVVYNEPKALEYFSNKSIKLNFSREFAILVTDYKGNIYYITASSCLSLKSGEGSVKSINARLLKPEMETPSVLLKNLGFKRRR
jgi:hypothetical protein